ncbi:transcriptional regulator, BadM/Rrf2 family [Rhodococcus koreensis]|uniref:nitric oxide dioxygenase n=2 Tax=Rhodococcus koreensis TaxID=99653 RepID=A0A1H4YI73_9NOCA|nr:transcriptional regulator, BadM/Rrf2 family [Rhodococcus koreensis]
MQLTQFTDLGLRVVMRLAVAGDGERPGSRAIAEELSVSYTHAAKVITRLGELGIVDARRGRAGGLAITELGRTASVGWLARRLEGDAEVVDCDGAQPCPLRSGCLLRSALRRAQNAFFESLDGLTVEDLTRTPTGTVLLALPGWPPQLPSFLERSENDMLSPTSTDVIRATLPVVGAAISDITTLFYRKMFDAHPELERDLFNRGNQKQGEQQKALAGAIAAFAALQLEPDQARVDLILSRIANKHASLGIEPSQYAIVHTHLFAAIVEVLGDAVTPEVAAAWDEVYWLMAETLIAMEAGLYASAGVAAGDVWRDVRVRERRHESADTVSFVLTSVDGSPLPSFTPGQYLSVAVRLPDGARQIRQYSLSSAPSRGDWRISVKRAGEVSNFLYHNVFEDDVLTVSTPFGDLVLQDDDAPLLLVSAGIGCTPMIGMLSHLADTDDSRPISVLHADRSASSHAHRAELTELVERLPFAVMHRWYEDLGTRRPVGGLREGRADLGEVTIAPGTRAYLCGPLPFMLGIREALLAKDVPAENIHYEVFGPDSWSATV